jgi:hypothetical protein
LRVTLLRAARHRKSESRHRRCRIHSRRTEDSESGGRSAVPMDAEPQNEDLRMTHRTMTSPPRLARNRAVRHAAAKATRDYLDSQVTLRLRPRSYSKSTGRRAIFL